MSRRTKLELQIMRELVKNFLEDTENNPHNAYDKYTEFYFKAEMSSPHFIHGIKDFIKVSKEYKSEYEYTQLLKQKEKQDKELVKEYQSKIWELTMDNDYPKIKELFKNSIRDKQIALCDLMMAISNISKGGRKEDWKFNAEQIRIYKELNII